MSVQRTDVTHTGVVETNTKYVPFITQGNKELNDV